MQKNAKTPFFKLAQEEVLRATVFSVTVLFCFFIAGSASIAFAAANGGLFGEILNKMLASSDFTNAGNGTVKNATKLDGKSSSEFQKIIAGQSCGSNMCVAGFDLSGNIKCR